MLCFKIPYLIICIHGYVTEFDIGLGLLRFSSLKGHFKHFTLFLNVSYILENVFFEMDINNIV